MSGPDSEKRESMWFGTAGGMRIGAVGHGLVVVALLSAGMAIPLMLGAGGKTIEARRIELRDKEGRVRIVLDPDGDSPGIRLLDSRGKVRVRLRASVDDPGLAITDAGEEVKVDLFYGEGEGPSLGLEGDRFSEVILGVNHHEPQLVLSGGTDAGALQLGVWDERTGLVLVDPSGKERERVLVEKPAP